MIPHNSTSWVPVLPQRRLTDVSARNVTLIPSIKPQYGFGARLMTRRAHGASAERGVCWQSGFNTCWSCKRGEIFCCRRHVFVRLITRDVGTLMAFERNPEEGRGEVLYQEVNDSVTPRAHRTYLLGNYLHPVQLVLFENRFCLLFFPIWVDSKLMRIWVTSSLCVFSCPRFPIDEDRSTCCKDCGLYTQAGAFSAVIQSWLRTLVKKNKQNKPQNNQYCDVTGWFLLDLLLQTCDVFPCHHCWNAQTQTYCWLFSHPPNSFCGVFFFFKTRHFSCCLRGAAVRQKSLSIKPTPPVADKVIRHHVTSTSPHQHISVL